jgi:hypothetical protein
VFCYSLLGQAGHAPDVLIAGSDITGLLLGRAWDGTRHREWPCAGTASIEAHAELLEALVEEMDASCRRCRRGSTSSIRPWTRRWWCTCSRSSLVCSAPRPANPQAKVNGKAPPTVLARIKLAVLRLLSEGRKVAFRVVMLAQRFEAEAVGGGYACDQFARSVSFRVLHGDDARPLGAAHQAAEPGVAVVSARGRELARVRAPYVGDYAAFLRPGGPGERRGRPRRSQGEPRDLAPDHLASAHLRNWVETRRSVAAHERGRGWPRRAAGGREPAGAHRFGSRRGEAEPSYEPPQASHIWRNLSL